MNQSLEEIREKNFRRIAEGTYKGHYDFKPSYQPLNQNREI